MLLDCLILLLFLTLFLGYSYESRNHRTQRSEPDHPAAEPYVGLVNEKPEFVMVRDQSGVNLTKVFTSFFNTKVLCAAFLY